MAQVEKRSSAVPAPLEWEYAPAPEARDIVQIRESYGLFIGGEEVAARSGESLVSISPSSEEQLFEFALAGPEDVGLAVTAARSAFEDGWAEIAPSERAKYLFRIARILQERSREFAVAESLDGGKPIRESRDVDLPLAAAHFFYYAGWADKLEYAFPNRTPRPVGVAAQIIPWNFPLLMLAWKIAPALACGNTVVAETGRDDAADRSSVHRRLPAGGASARRREHRHGRRHDRRASRQARGHRQGRVHRFDGGRQADHARARRPGGAPDARARREGREHRLRRRRARPGGRGHRQRHLLQPGPRLLRRARGSSCRSRSTSR